MQLDNAVDNRKSISPFRCCIGLVSLNDSRKEAVIV